MDGTSFDWIYNFEVTLFRLKDKGVVPSRGGARKADGIIVKAEI